MQIVGMQSPSRGLDTTSRDESAESRCLISPRPVADIAEADECELGIATYCFAYDTKLLTVDW